MSNFKAESSRDENTGLECWLVVDTRTSVVMDRLFDRQDAEETAEFFQDMEDERDLEHDGQPSEYDEWMDYDPEC
jgi:hypothetical protein